MKYKKICIIFIIFLFFVFFINSEIKFDPIALNLQNTFLFNSVEIIAGNQYNRTLFYGYMRNSNLIFEAASFYPENFFYSSNEKKLYIQNRMGLYTYDIANEIVKPIEFFPNYVNNDEYIIYRLSKTSFSPNYRYALAKVATTNVGASIYLYDFQNKTAEKIITDVEIGPGESVGYWSNDSNYFVYQKKGNIYYFSIIDYKRKKLLNEEWRFIGKVKLNNTRWTEGNYLIWIEGNLIYQADPHQFFSRSIYRKYLRQGVVIGKIPFDFDTAFDSFRYNEIAKKFIIVKNFTSIFYYSLIDDLIQSPYIQLNDKMRFEDCWIFDNGEAILIKKILDKGRVNKKIIILKREKGTLLFNNFEPNILEGLEIYNFSISNDNNQFVVNTSNGAYCFDFATLKLIWKYEEEKIIQSINIDYDEWILGGIYTTFKATPKLNIFKPIFASSFNESGFVDDKISVICNKKNYIIDKSNKTLSEYVSNDFELYKETKTNSCRLISREIKKGFYKEGVYLKDLYSGKLSAITGKPNLRYKLYQPETKLGAKYYHTPSSEKHEVALVFNCKKTAEGIFPILTTLDQFKITATFFINGNFMEINSVLTKEILNFDIEVGNMFQYYVNLTDSDFLIDKNFIRQGLSTNEEKFYQITGKNFSPLWHSPMYSFNDSIIKYGEESGYKYVSFNLDSLDWIGENNSELNSNLYMNNSQLINRILKKIKPGQIIIFSTGKNNSVRSDWLFNNLDLLISELVRAGYSFTSVSDLLKKYREE